MNDYQKDLYLQQRMAPLSLQLQLGLASPEKIRSFSYGEVINSRTVNHNTREPEDDGLFCPKIFGPTKEWRCKCGKYAGHEHRGIVCESCGVECNNSKVRYERMGHIELAIPVVHPWYVNWISDLLSIALEDLRKVVYYESYIVIDAGNTPLDKNILLSTTDYATVLLQYGNHFAADHGSKAIKKLLAKIDLDGLYLSLTNERGENYRSRQIEIIQWLQKSNSKPEWMVLEVIPVIPPMLRPFMNREDSPAFDINKQYKKIINQNLRLKELINLNVHEEILIIEKRKLQEYIDELFSNERWGDLRIPWKFPDSFNVFIKDLQGLGFDVNIQLFKP